MLPPDEQPPNPLSKPDQSEGPRHPFTYRAPAPSKVDGEALPSNEVAAEARRNDAVLVGASVLMSVVFACTTIADSRVLVHVKTGEYLASNGILPPRTDVFSATASDRMWVNLGWLFDLCVAGLHEIGGMIALSIFQILAAIAVVLLLFTFRRQDTSSWWASFVVVLASIAMMPHFEARPVAVTLLGLGVTLWVLSRYRREVEDRVIWLLIPHFAVWSNLDPRMFLGLATLVFYGLGEFVGHAIGKGGFEDGSRRLRYWLAVVASIVVSMLNPFLWKAPLGFWDLYRRVDASYTQYYAGEQSWLALEHLSIFQHPWSSLLDTALLASLLLGVVSLTTMILNHRRLDLSHLALWLGFVAFGMFTGREWPTAALVFGAIAIQNAEEWYRHSFRQNYTADRGELFFSRGGRAVTVLAFFTIAVLWLSGRVVPDDGRRPGLGLDPSLENQVSSFSVLFEDSFDDRVFNFTAGQGDLLIWSGVRPFIDHRLDIYAAKRQDEDLISLHDKVRNALRTDVVLAAGDPLADRPEAWQSALQRFNILQAIPRLTFPRPSYQTYFDLLKSRDWELTKLHAAGAVFVRVNSETSDYLKANRLDLAKAAFRDPEELPDVTPGWARPRVWSDSLTRPAALQNELALSLHYLRHLEEAKQGNLGLSREATMAFSYLAIREGYRTLASDPQNLNAYRSLGQAYETLYLSELNGTGIQMRRRIYQALNAYGQALTIAQQDPVTHERLVGLYLVFNKLDLSARAKEQYELLSGQELPMPLDGEAASQLASAWNQIHDNIERVTQQADEALENGQPRRDVAIFAWQNGCTLLALELLDQDLAANEETPDVTMLRALLLLEAARPQEAYDLLMSLEGIADKAGFQNWRDALALASLALPDFERAESLWHEQALQANERHLMSAMNAVPLGGQLHGQLFFPVWQTSQVLQAMEGASRDVAEPALNAALCALEEGRVEDVDKRLSRLLAEHPFSPFTNLAGSYLAQIRGAPVQLSLGLKPEESQFDVVEMRLNERLTTDRLKAVGPVEASRK